MSKPESLTEETWYVGPVDDPGIELGWGMPSEEFPVDETVEIRFVPPRSSDE